MQKIAVVKKGGAAVLGFAGGPLYSTLEFFPSNQISTLQGPLYSNFEFSLQISVLRFAGPSIFISSNERQGIQTLKSLKKSQI